jgi:hypothetical protein
MPDRLSANNSNWKGGISLFKTADELLTMAESVQQLVLDRLYDNIVEAWNGCWIWTGPVFKSKRARLTLGKNNHVAARLMFVLTRGSASGLCVLHTCDEVLCVNPDHLFLGTNADNSTDMVNKGRSAPQHGTLNPRAILTEEIVSVVKQRLRNGEKQNKIAIELGVCKATINNIAVGKSWNHVQ